MKPPLDQYYTKTEIAEHCVKLLFDYLYGIGKNPYNCTFTEPSAGAGAFIEALKNKGISKIKAYDIDPKHPDIIKMDFLKTNITYVNLEWLSNNNQKNKYKVAIGNPPFGTKYKDAIKFLNHASNNYHVIGFILPIRFEGYLAQNQLSKNLKLINNYDLPENSFITPDKKEYNNTRCCFQIWTIEGNQNNRTKTRPPTSHKDFEIYIYNCTKETLKYFNYDWDFAIRRQGRGDYTELKKPENKNDMDRRIQWIFLKAKNLRILHRLKSMDFEELSKKNSNTPGFGKADIIKKYIRIKEKEKKNKLKIKLDIEQKEETIMCKECRCLKPINEFSKSTKNFKSKNYCYDCKKAIQKTFDNQNPNKLKLCPQCLQMKSITKFYPDIGQHDRRTDRCKKCTNIYNNSPATPKILNRIDTPEHPIKNGKIQCFYCGNWFIVSILQAIQRCKVMENYEKKYWDIYGRLYDCKECQEADPFSQKTGSIWQYEISGYIENLGYPIDRDNEKIIINPNPETNKQYPYLQLDIVIYSKDDKLKNGKPIAAIECQGTYWHGLCFPKTQKRDEYKKEQCEKLGIPLFTPREKRYNENKEYYLNKIIKPFIESSND